MRSRRCLLFAALFVALVAGCQFLQPYRPVSVVAVDAETKKPIPGANVHISYPLDSSYSAPAGSSGVTGDDGVALLRVAPVKEAFQVEADAPGYLREERSLPADAAQAAQPAPVVVEVYAAPGPSVELVVPVGFRGRVQVETRIQDDLPFPAGQRCFRYEVPPSGVVQITGPALFRRVPAVHAIYADGTPLATDAQPLDVAFRWVKSENGYECYLVGTQIECNALRKTPDERSASSDGGKTQSRGHRGRRGNPSASDSSASTANPDSP